MWPFKREVEIELVSHIKSVRRTIYLTDKSTIVSYMQEVGTAREGAPPPANYHFEARTRHNDEWDSSWSHSNDSFFLRGSDPTALIRRDMITKITYEVVE